MLYEFDFAFYAMRSAPCAMRNRKEKENMPTINGNAKKMIKGLFWVPVLLVGVSGVTYTVVIPEPAKLLLLGAFLMGLAFWGRKQLVEHGVRGDAQSAERTAPVSTEVRVLSTEGGSEKRG